jgi:hypothetical protein
MYAPTGINPESECRRRIRKSWRAKNDCGELSTLVVPVIKKGEKPISGRFFVTISLSSIEELRRLASGCLANRKPLSA